MNSFKPKQRNVKIPVTYLVIAAIAVSLITNLALRKDVAAATGSLVCGTQEHTHTGDSYTLVHGTLDCPYANKPMIVHSHDDSCYVDGVLSCPLEEIQEHKHDDSCYENVLVLACEEDHANTEDCYKEETVLTCEKEEVILHEHDDSCFELQRVLSCEEDHEHTDECYEEKPVLICEKPEVIAHQHDESFFTKDELVLTCTLEEHEHTDDCYGPANEDDSADVIVNAEGFNVNLNYESSSDARRLPGMKANEILPGDERYEELSQETAQLLAKSNTYVRFFDITPLDHSLQSQEPTGNADVTVDLKTIMDDEEHLVASLSDVQVLHFTEDSVTELEATANDTSVTFKTDSFSVFAIVYTVDFHYEGYFQSIAGGGSVLLSQLFSWLSIDLSMENVDQVTFSNPDLMRIRYVTGIVELDTETHF